MNPDRGNRCRLGQIHMAYGKEQVLRGVDLLVPRGGILGLVGENGSGKSTLLRILAGVQRPDSGALVTVGPRPRVGYMPENCQWYPYLTGAETLSYFASFHGAGREAQEKLLRRVGLWPARDKKVGAYSKGMKQKLGLAQALLGDPDLLILDEPTNGLDPAGICEFYALLAERAALGVSVVLSSHLLAEIEDHLTHVAFLQDGLIVHCGQRDELLAAADLPSTVIVRGEDATSRLRPLVSADGYETHECCEGLWVVLSRREVPGLLRILVDADLVDADVDVRHAGLEDLFAASFAGGVPAQRRRCAVTRDAVTRGGGAA